MLFIAAGCRTQAAGSHEPFSGLDPVSEDALRERFWTYGGEGHGLLSTHDMNVAENVRLLFLIFRGRMVLTAPSTHPGRYGNGHLRVSVRVVWHARQPARFEKVRTTALMQKLRIGHETTAAVRGR